ncbi:hypothetical protein [Leptospira sarikeiensis]|uniref:Uncharacterized protein n=1 Tax=Leptospira sarikeiensis TaxID=2484943 RepID=A0A4R9K0N0_9LEPT|nr:hypothetical protein [Leptospira sarikeiensis]TGL57579.1 hypothetical protein EHQ64_19470 [Leptospira sarikeiensis]
MKRLLWILFVFPNILFSESLPSPFSMGVSFSGYDSRFYTKRQETIWIRTDLCLKYPILFESFPECSKHKFFLEKRGETFLGSYLYEDQRIYLSYGNRFRPLQHFFFLRETFDFSSFWFLEQPTVRTGFLGIKIGESMFGSYYAENSAKKQPGFFFKPYKNYLEFAYSPETKEGFFLLEFPSSEERKSETKPYWFRTEIYGTKADPQGIFSASWSDREKDRRIFFSGFRGRAGQLFNLSDSREPEERAELFRFVWEPGLYQRFQFAESDLYSSDGKRSYSAKSILGRISILEFPWIAVLAQLRTYSFSETSEWIWGRGLYLSYQKRFWKWEIGQEWRKNGDRLTEAGIQLSIGKEWKIYSSLVYADERNLLPSFAEESITPEETGLVVNDKAFYSFLRIFHPYFAIHIRHTREKESSGDGLSVRFQVYLPVLE